MAFDQTRANEYMKGKDQTTGKPVPIGMTGTGMHVTGAAINVTQAQFNALSLTAADAGKEYSITDGTNAGDIYRWNGTAMELVQRDGAVLVQSSGGFDGRGNYPATWYLQAVNSAGAADNDVLYTSGDVSMYNTHLIQNNDTMNIDVHVSLDGTTFVGPIDLEGTLTAAGAVGGSEVGILRGKFYAIRVDQAAAGTCEAGNVLIAHGVE